MTIQTHAPAPDAPRHDARDAFADTLLELARLDGRIVAVVNDSIGSSKLGEFQKEFPERTINVGIAEQTQVGAAAGLANAGKIPFVSCAGSFLTARAMEQVKVDCAYSFYNVKLCAQSPGMGYGNLGATHHSLEDIAWMRAIANMAVVVPADHRETAQVIRWAAEYEGPVYIRVSRLGLPDVTRGDFEFGKASVLAEGDDVTIATNGVCTVRALEAADILAAEGISARVLHIPTVKPLDVDAVVSAARETGAIVTVEEATTFGALGGAVAEVVCDHHPVPVARLGVPDVFAPTGAEPWLLDHFGMSPEGIASTCRETIARKA
ncbi:MAG: transketolase C-terminal domain-containing protein [bacterium]|nr:transketolase C-terminal domain-containing protein [bacterium]